MKLLIITQKVSESDHNLGFFCKWIEEFSKQVKKLYVVCLEKREYSLNENVHVIALGKEKGCAKIKILYNFYRSILSLRREYDAVFVHMNPIYIVLGGFVWKILGKSISLWYTHRMVDLKLRIAEKFCDVIFTASKKSFRLKSDKVIITGHGIDTDLFKPIERKAGNGKFRIIIVGRITPAKNQLKLVQLLNELNRDSSEIDFVLDIIGSPAVKSDFEYFEKIKNYIKENKLEPYVKLAGPLEQREMVQCYNKADLLVNLSHTGSLDKDVLEALSCNTDVLTANEAFHKILPSEYNVKYNDKDILEALRKKMDNRGMEINLRDIIVSNHNLQKLIVSIVNILSSKRFAERP